METDINKMSIEQLKSRAYDEFIVLGKAQKNIQILETMIAELSKKAEENKHDLLTN